MNTSKGDIKVGDKFVIEIGEIIPDKNGKLLYKIKGFNALVFDDVGINRLERPSKPSAEALKESWSAGYDTGMQSAIISMSNTIEVIKDELRRSR